MSILTASKIKNDNLQSCEYLQHGPEEIGISLKANVVQSRQNVQRESMNAGYFKCSDIEVKQTDSAIGFSAIILYTLYTPSLMSFN